MLQSRFQVNNEVQTMLTPILIPDKNTRELINNVNPTSKKLNFSCFLYFFMFRQNLLEKWEENNPS